MKRLHIVGCPRSGTTLLLHLIGTCFVVDGFCEFEMNIYKEPPGEYSLYASKRPTDIKIIKPVLYADENLYVIYLVRDPRAVVSSVHQSVPDKYFCPFLLWQECDRPARELNEHQRFMVLRYEDLASDPDAVQQRIEEKFPFLQRRCAFSQYQQHSSPSARAVEAMNGFRPVDTGRIHSWQQHLPRIKAQLETYPQMLEALRFYGYEPDDAWTSMLASVTAEHTPSRHRSDKGFWFRLEWKFRNWRRLRKKLRRIARRGLK